jgi:hypothetical protein
METRNLSEIQRELEEATERRTALWKELSKAHDEATAVEIDRLSERIEALWTEARVARTRARFGSPDAILSRARAEERLEREYAKVA